MARSFACSSLAPNTAPSMGTFAPRPVQAAKTGLWEKKLPWIVTLSPATHMDRAYRLSSADSPNLAGMNGKTLRYKFSSSSGGRVAFLVSNRLRTWPVAGRALQLKLLQYEQTSVSLCKLFFAIIISKSSSNCRSRDEYLH